MRIVSHVWRAPKACQPSDCDRRRVGIGIHLQRRTDKPIDRVLSGKLAQNAVRAQATIPSGKKDIRACRYILIHPDFTAEGMDALDPSTFDCRDECRMRVQRPVLADLPTETERLSVSWQ